MPLHVLGMINRSEYSNNGGLTGLQMAAATRALLTACLIVISLGVAHAVAGDSFLGDLGQPSATPFNGGKYKDTVRGWEADVVAVAGGGAELVLDVEQAQGAAFRQHVGPGSMIGGG